MLTVSELFAHADFYAHHPQIKEFASTSGYSNAAIITIFLSEQKAINTFNGDFSKLVSAIQALAQQTAEPTVYSRQFHILALASVIERPIYAVYPDIPSAWAVKLACHGYFYPRKVFQSESNLETVKDDAIIVMWTRTDRMPLWAGYPITLFCCKRPVQFLHARVMPQFLLAMNQTKSEHQQISELLQSKLRGVQSEVHPTLILGRSQHLPHVPKNHHQTVSRNQLILCRPTRNLHPTANRLGRNQLILYHDTNN